MEETSREWQEKQYRDLGSASKNDATYSLPPSPPTLEEAHTFTVAVQRKRKSWDTMPATDMKPYGTTTMCHLVEMMAGLGVYWKEFDRRRDRYRAEGNGFVVFGERMSDLGLIFSFQVYGKCLFEWNRVIPVDDVKELCFGYVSTIYRTMSDHSRLETPNSELHSLATLQMASRSEIAQTLAAIGCTNNAVKYFLDEASRTYHLFPLSFEILGMLSRTFHIQDSSFTYIPNPTSDRWDKKSFSLVRVMESYRVLSGKELPQGNRNSTIYSKITQHITQILEYQDEVNDPDRLLFLKALHAAINDCDEILTARGRGEAKTAGPLGPGQPSASSHELRFRLARQNQRRKIVPDVVRSHIQEVLRLFNEPDEQLSDAQSFLAPDMPSVSPRESRYHERIISPWFEDVDACGPDEKQFMLMEVYFEVIQMHVVHYATRTAERRASFAGVHRNLGILHFDVGAALEPIRVSPSNPILA